MFGKDFRFSNTLNFKNKQTSLILVNCRNLASIYLNYPRFKFSSQEQDIIPTSFSRVIIIKNTSYISAKRKLRKIKILDKPSLNSTSISFKIYFWKTTNKPIKMTISKNNKMMQHLNYKMKIIVQDNRTFIGYFKAFDKHMNVILADCEELRRIKPKVGKKTTVEEEKRILGLVLLRGDKIISISVEGPPQREDSGAQIPRAGGLGGPGQAKGAGRGMPMGPPQGMPMGVPPGLQGPVRGMGGPGMGGVMQPGFPGGMPPPGVPGGMPPRF